MSSEFELLDAWRAGDKRAGNQLFRDHYSSVCRFFDCKLEGDVGDLVQATFLSCLRVKDQFRKQASFRTYLLAIARRELYRYLRALRRDRERIDFGVSSIVDLMSSTPSRRIDRQQSLQVLAHALRSLPVEQQILLELHYWEDMDMGELAEVLGVARETARVRLFRARQALRTLIEAERNVPSGVADSAELFEQWARSLRLEPAPRSSDEVTRD